MPQVDIVTKQGKNALMLAAQYGRDEICEYLIEKGSKVDQQDSDGQTALFAAVQAAKDPIFVRKLPVLLNCCLD